MTRVQDLLESYHIEQALVKHITHPWSGMLQYLVVNRDENMKSAWSSSGEKAAASATKGDDDDESDNEQPEEDKDDSSVSSKGKDEESRPSKQKKGRKNRESSTTLQAKWDEMFNRLLQFRRKHGHCLGKVAERKNDSLTRDYSVWHALQLNAVTHTLDDVSLFLRSTKQILRRSSTW